MAHQKHNFGQIFTFGDSCTDPLYLLGPNLVCWSVPTVYAHVPNLVLIGLFCRPLGAKAPPKFTILLNLAFCGVANWRRSETVEHGCTTTNLPLSKGIKVVSVFQRLQSDICKCGLHMQTACTHSCTCNVYCCHVDVVQIRRLNAHLCL